MCDGSNIYISNEDIFIKQYTNREEYIMYGNQCCMCIIHITWKTRHG